MHPHDGVAIVPTSSVATFGRHVSNGSQLPREPAAVIPREPAAVVGNAPEPAAVTHDHVPGLLEVGEIPGTPGLLPSMLTWFLANTALQEPALYCAPASTYSSESNEFGSLRSGRCAHVGGGGGGVGSHVRFTAHWPLAGRTGVKFTRWQS